MERYRALLVVKGFAQKEGIYFNERFDPVLRLTRVRVVLAMCATLDLYLEQLGVKTSSWRTELEEKISPTRIAEESKVGLQVEQISIRSQSKEAPRVEFLPSS